MQRLGKRTEQRLRRLARLRAEGLGWPAIAEQTGWPARGCEALTARHAGQWRRLLRDALKSHVLEGLAEGCAILRICLRNTDARVRRTAASSLTHYLRLFGPRRPPQPGALTPKQQQQLE